MSAMKATACIMQHRILVAEVSDDRYDRATQSRIVCGGSRSSGLHGSGAHQPLPLADRAM